jgi:hypothetical protein
MNMNSNLLQDDLALNFPGPHTSLTCDSSAPPAFPCLDVPNTGPTSDDLNARSPVKETGSVGTSMGLGSEVLEGMGNGQHKVSIDMVCTTAQLKNIMIWLVGAGPGVRIKIDTP